MDNSALYQSVNEFASHYGVTDVANMYSAAVSTASAIKSICLPLVLVALTFVFLGQMTRWVVGEQSFDLIRFGRFLLLLLVLVNYEEILAQLNTVISYFADAAGPTLGNYSSGSSLTDKVNQLLEYNGSKENYNLFTDGLSDLLDWLVANCSHMIIVVSRSVVYCIRELYMMFLIATGPVAVLLSMLPFFDKTLYHWLSAYLSAGCWALTMGVLDRLLNAYLDRMLQTHDGNGLVVMNIGIALMYLMVPYITNKYIGAAHSHFMTQMSGMGTRLWGAGGRLVGAAEVTSAAVSDQSWLTEQMPELLNSKRGSDTSKRQPEGDSNDKFQHLKAYQDITKQENEI